ncbi:hypothetical protein DR087_03700 [Mycoplasma hyopneumoniae]|nr:hypothetical protein [Mesomycoplasma hyopneumoniae]
MLILDTFKKVCQNKQYRFTAEDKSKYIKIVKSKGLKIAILDFTEEFSQIYKKEKCKIDTKSHFWMYMKQFNKKLTYN